MVNGAVTLFTKCAELPLSLGKRSEAVGAFIRRFDPAIGEELTHRLSGQRFFRNLELNGRDVSYGSIAKKLTPDGYRGVSLEEFEKLKKMQIHLKNKQYGQHVVHDDYTGIDYWGRHTIDGRVAAMQQDYGVVGRTTCPDNIWAKLENLLDVSKAID